MGMDVQTLQERLEYAANQRARREAERLISTLPYISYDMLEFYSQELQKTVTIRADNVLPALQRCIQARLETLYLEEATKELLDAVERVKLLTNEQQ